MNKKIIISVNTSWNVYNFRLSLIEELINKKYDIYVIAGKDEYTLKLLEKGIKVYTVNFNEDKTDLLSIFNLLINYLKIFKKINPDIYLPFTIKPNIFGGFIASILKIKTINNIAGLGRGFDKNKIFVFLLKIIYKTALYKSKYVFFQNADDRKLFKTEKIIKNKNNSVLPGSGVDLNRFVYKKIPNKNTFLFAARLLKEKGIYEFIQIASKLKGTDCRFIIAGSLNEKDKSYVSRTEINEWINKYNIEFKGLSDNIEYLIYEASCVVLPSYYREGVPRILLESGACGRPIITTDMPGCREVVNSRNGYLCKPKDVDSLFNCISEFISTSYEKKINMGLESRKLIEEKFSDKIIIEAYIDKCLN